MASIPITSSSALGHEFLPELSCEGGPVGEAERAILRLMVKLPSGPAAGTSGLHVGHHPVDLGRVVLEGLWTGADVRPARCVEGPTSEAVAVKLWW